MKKISLSIAVFLCAYHPPLAAANSNILLKPVSIKPALEGYKKISGALDKPDRYVLNHVYRQHENAAKTVGLALPKWFNKKYIHGGKALIGQNGHEFRFYTMFSNTAYMKNCERDFALQRVKVTKEYFDANKKNYKTEVTYLVEAFKMQNNKMKGADVHHGSYSLVGNGSRRITKELEFGCGAIQGYAQGHAWPFAKNTLYKNLTGGYIQTPALYENVQFNFSEKYQYSVLLHNRDNYELTLPQFVTSMPIKN